MNRSLLLLLLWPLSLLTAVAQDEVRDMDEMVVTATRTPKTLKNVPVQTRVISRSDIEKSDATNLQDLLEMEIPGVEYTIAMNGLKNMNLSGFSGQNVLILVDGERLSGETNDNVDYTRLSMANVERVEIVRGSASALYGSNAVGGVINIITRGSKAAQQRPDEPHETKKTDWSLRLDGRYGSHHQQRYNAVSDLSRGRFHNNLAFSATAIDNFKLDSHGSQPQGMLLSESYGDKTVDVREQLSVDITNKLRVSGRLGYFYRTVSLLPDVPERYRDYLAGLKAAWQLSATDHMEASYSFDQYDKSDYQRLKDIDVRRYSNVQNGGRLLYSHDDFFDRQGDKSRSGTLTVGADYLYDYLCSRNVGEENYVQQSADVFAQYDWNINERWELVGALRYDAIWGWNPAKDKNVLQQHVTPRVAMRWSPTEHCRLRASYGMGFRAPSLKEKYYDLQIPLWIIEGNALLKAESSHNVSLSTEYFHGGYSVTIGGTYNHLTDHITSGLPYQKSGTQQYYLPYVNVDAMNVFGADITLQGRWKHGWSAKLAYAYCHEEVAKGSLTPYMPTRPHTLTLRGDWEHRFNKHFRLDVGLTGRVLSGVTNSELLQLGDPSAGLHDVSYPAYTMWKLQAVGHVNKWGKLTLTVDNLFNYIPKYYYLNAPITTGIGVMGGIAIVY